MPPTTSCSPRSLLRPLLHSTPPKRLSSTYTQRPSPNKSHLHAPLPSTSFPKGYVLTGLHAGVKKTSGIPDVGVIVSTVTDRKTSAAACFTRNAFKAAPVLVSDAVLRKSGGYARAVVVNSGCANAVTGRQGMEDAWRMVRETDALLPALETGNGDGALKNAKGGGEGEKHSETLVMSTGVIGQTLPIERISAGIARARESLAGDFAAWERTARAFMTTDTFPKLRARAFTLRGVEYRLAGMDKGAGMIHPNMGPASTSFVGAGAGAPRGLHATLLGCIMTDAAVSPRSLQSALTYAVDRSFNSISVDGDMSTNDSIYVLANGAAAPSSSSSSSSASSSIIDEETDPEGYEVFKNELTAFAADLAQLVVRDGEGATKFVTVTVTGAACYADAHAIASRISTSALVKTALYGEDANWGRILAATGSVPLHPSSSSSSSSSAPTLDPTKVSVTFVPSDGTPPLPVLVNGEPETVDEVRAKEIMVQDEFEVLVELGMGKEEARYWTCDFSYEYVSINGDYRS